MTDTQQQQMTGDEWAQEVLAEIVESVRAGHVPANVGSFSELHDHLDANCYLEDVPEGEGQQLHALRNDVADRVDALIKDGTLARAAASRMMR